MQNDNAEGKELVKTVLYSSLFLFYVISSVDQLNLIKGQAEQVFMEYRLVKFRGTQNEGLW